MILKKEKKKNKGGAVEGMVLEVKYDISYGAHVMWVLCHMDMMGSQDSEVYIHVSSPE
jgi:hypothetical protein